jgi:hypothetical protein
MSPLRRAPFEGASVPPPVGYPARIEAWDFAGMSDAPAVGAGATLAPGLVDLAGNTFAIAGGKLVNLAGNPRTNWLMLGATPLKHARLEVTFDGANLLGSELVDLHPKCDPAAGPLSALRTFVRTSPECQAWEMVNGNHLSGGSWLQSPAGIAAGRRYRFRADAVDIDGAVALYATLVEEAAPETLLGWSGTQVVTPNPALRGPQRASLSGFAATALLSAAVYDLTPPAAPLPRQADGTPVVLAYLGSSTWEINGGSGTPPALIEANLRATYPAAQIITVNGAVGGSASGDWLPGSPNLTALKAAVMAAGGAGGGGGCRVLRLMIGSNDAAAGVPVATWLAHLRAIIADAFTWPVQEILLEAIGTRNDGGPALIAAIAALNAARNQLAAPHVHIGGATTLEDQGAQGTLSPDTVHQTDLGHRLLAAKQAAEVRALFV